MKKKPFNTNFKSFANETLNHWNNTNSFKNSGQLNILKYAFITSIFWAMQRNDEVNKNAKSDYQNLIQPTLFF